METYNSGMISPNPDLISKADDSTSYLKDRLKSYFSKLKDEELVVLLKQELVENDFKLEGTEKELEETNEFLSSLFHYPTQLIKEYDNSIDNLVSGNTRIASMRAQIAIEDAKQRKIDSEKRLKNLKFCYKTIRKLHIFLLEKEKASKVEGDATEKNI